MVLVNAFAVFCGLAIIVFGIASISTGYTLVGVILIVVGTATIISVVGLSVSRKIREKRHKEAIAKRIEDYNLWLQNQNLNSLKVLGGSYNDGFKNYRGFAFDDEKKVWFQYNDNNIYEYACIKGAEINKKRSTVSTTSRSSSGNSSSSSSSFNFGKYGTRSGSGKRSGSGQSTRVSNDASTYTVLINTDDINMPVVEIPCGQDAAAAQSIVNTVKIIMKNSAPSDISVKLEKYKKLLNEGLITEEEYELKRKQLLEI